MLLIAVAGTSKRRYPKQRDKKAFLQFVQEDVQPIWDQGNLQEEEPPNQDNLNHAAFLSGNPKAPPTSKIPDGIGDILYHFLRCNLIHESELPGDVKYDADGGFAIRIDHEAIFFSPAWVRGLEVAVMRAPENSAEFPEYRREDGVDDI